MSFSLEAMGVVPLVLTICLQSSALIVPEAHNARNTAAKASEVLAQEINPPHLYQINTLRNRAGAMTLIQSSPQKVLEAVSVATDVVQQFK